MIILQKPTHSTCIYASNKPFWIRLATVKHVPPSDQTQFFNCEFSLLHLTQCFDQVGQDHPDPIPPSPFHQFNLHQKWFHQLANDCELEGTLWPFYAKNAALPQDNIKTILHIHNDVDLYNTTSCFEWVTLRCHHKIQCHRKVRHRLCFLSFKTISWNIIFYNMNVKQNCLKWTYIFNKCILYKHLR